MNVCGHFTLLILVAAVLPKIEEISLEKRFPLCLQEVREFDQEMHTLQTNTMYREEEIKSILQPCDINKTIDVKQSESLPQQANSKAKKVTKYHTNTTKPTNNGSSMNNDSTMK